MWLEGGKRKRLGGSRSTSEKVGQCLREGKRGVLVGDLQLLSDSQLKGLRKCLLG